ncbi:MAG: hypothetical protein O2912_02365 [Proteobacteria bacterium]|nr:hypothetical protein [Pseudomonadota bacterium]
MTKNTDQPGAETAERAPNELLRRQRSKNRALAGVLVGLVVLFYLVAIVRMGGS